MPSNFPTSYDALTNPVGTDAVAVVSHSSQHTNINDIIEALEAKLGIGASAQAPALVPAVLRRTASGQSAWSEIQPEDLAPAVQQAIAASNPIINGGMGFSQRGGSGSIVPSTAAYTFDRWSVANVTEATVAWSESGSVPAVAATVPFSSRSLAVYATAPDTSIGGSEYASLYQRIEGYLWEPFHQKQFTIGFWVRSAITGIYGLGFRNADSDRTYVVEYTISAPNIWEYKTITVSPSPASGTWNFTNGIGIFVEWGLAAGGLYSTSSFNTWLTGNTFQSGNQVNALNTGSTFILWGVTMGLGPTVAPYWPRPYAQELALCQRYYERVSHTGSPVPLGLGQAYSTTEVALSWPFKVRKRAIPTIFGAGAFACSNPSVLHAYGAGFSSALYTSTDTATVRITTGGGMVAGSAVVVNLDSVGTPYLEASADL